MVVLHANNDLLVFGAKLLDYDVTTGLVSSFSYFC